MTQAIPDEYHDFITACVDMIGRTGATNWELRYDDNDGTGVTVWMCLATYDGVSVRSFGNGIIREVPTRHEVAAAMRPDQAAFRLVETLCDGGECQHCKRPTSMHTDAHVPVGLTEPFCNYIYNPERKAFVRGCE
jgi:hypothetical protein